eukprot:CAMPEP_0168167392 /NCGR_PEP_ID=MMETSP0139_2-20121125/2524_1 /TAXON_ID=44445 /ORGANISM="Pseudo-nitzschia australis, Strain 10249 10 AB" /LENGTH=392 /DNA_ID=CAMNT_0008084629 /DNA_START=215 /DNA_END=1393 /DNA_ORIENTATION=-
MIIIAANLCSKYATTTAFSTQKATTRSTSIVQLSSSTLYRYRGCSSKIGFVSPSQTQSTSKILLQQRQQHLRHTPRSKSSQSLLRMYSTSKDGDGDDYHSDKDASSYFQNHLDKIRRRATSSPVSPSSSPTNELRNRFFALRHGQSLANVAGLIASDPGVACHKYGLSEEGKKQAKKAGDQLVQDFLRVRKEQQQQSNNNDNQNENENSLVGIAIVTSDLLRAKETAQFAADAIHSHNSQCTESNGSSDAIPLHSDAIVIDTRLRERGFGEWDGGSDVHYHDVWKDDAIDPGHTMRGVESVWSVTNRATIFVLEWDQNLAEKADKGQQQAVVEAKRGDAAASNPYDYYWVVCVAHGDVLQILQTAFSADMDPSQHRLMEHLETATLRPLELT